MKEKPDTARGSSGQIVWGILLVAMGIAVFFRIPQVAPRLKELTQTPFVLSFMRFCLYLMGVLLVGGGIKKIITQYRLDAKSSKPDSDEKADST